KSCVGRLELVDRSADGTFHLDILVVLTAECKVRGRGITIWQRHITDDEAARIVLDDSTDAARRPEIPMHVIVDAVRSTVAGIVAPGRREEECRVRRILGAFGA